MYKKLAGILFFLLLSSFSFGQFYKSILPSPQFNSALEKIILDFREDYKNIQGAKLDQLGSVEVYKSLVELPGTLENKILRFHSTIDTTASWQAIVYKGDEYKDAVKAYQNVFRLVKKSQIKWIDRSNVTFAGELEAAREELRFTTSTLALVLDDNRYKNFQAEVSLQFLYNGWEVQLNLSKKGNML